MSTRRRNGFGFGERFHRDLAESAPLPPADPGADTEKPPIPVVVYCPFRCPFCGARFPDNRGSGRQRLPLHYLVCQECNREYHAQEADHGSVTRLAQRLHPG